MLRKESNRINNIAQKAFVFLKTFRFRISLKRSNLEVGHGSRSHISHKKSLLVYSFYISIYGNLIFWVFFRFDIMMNNYSTYLSNFFPKYTCKVSILSKNVNAIYRKQI